MSNSNPVLDKTITINNVSYDLPVGMDASVINGSIHIEPANTDNSGDINPGAIAKILGTTIAGTTVSVGEYVLYGGNLYKVNHAIADSDTPSTFEGYLDAVSGGGLNGLKSAIDIFINSVGILGRGEYSIPWNSSKVCGRINSRAQLYFGGRSGIGFVMYVPQDTNEYVLLANVDNAISAVSVTASGVTLTAKSSGYGSALFVTALEFSALTRS